MTHKIAFLPGDGVGPEVAAAARAVMMRAGEMFSIPLKFDEYDFGGVAIDRHGDPLPPATLTAHGDVTAVTAGSTRMCRAPGSHTVTRGRRPDVPGQGRGGAERGKEW